MNGFVLLSAGTMSDAALSRAIWNCKYRNLPYLAEPLAAWLADTVRNLPEARRLTGRNPLLMPVPLHPHKFAERGYNQAELLARALARIMALPVAVDAMVRVHNTASQVQRATRTERLENMRNAFAAKTDLVAGRDIIIVDDVSTTGATLTACAAALKEKGARSVSAIVLARG
jgi:ComF family protein